MATLVRACLDQDYDAATQTCAAEVWVVQDEPWSLSIADAQQIGMAFALLWATAFVFRLIRRFIQESG